jgi:hypothetical protein
LGYAFEPPTLDPLAPGGASYATRDLLQPVLPDLFRLTAGLKPEPDLVAEWPGGRDISLDPFTVRLRLRRATWSDGKPISAADVRFSWERLRAGPTGHRYRFLKDVRILGPRTFELAFDRPMRRWWSLFSLDDMVLPAHSYSQDWDRDGPRISGGPFAIGGRTEGLRVRLVRNGRYWGPKALVRGIDVVFVRDDEVRLQLLEDGELDAFFAEGETNIGRRSRARGWQPTGGALDGSGQASGAWGPTWWELDLDPRKLPASVAPTMIKGIDPALVAEILEDSGQVADGIPSRFPRAGAERDGLPAIDGPWSGRGEIPNAGAASFRLALARSGTGGAIARFIHFRLIEDGLRAELLELNGDVFERYVEGPDRAPVLLRLRRGADAPDAGGYSSDEPSAEGDIDRAESVGYPASTGVDARAWTAAQRALLEAATVAPLARVRSWIVGRDGLSGPRATGASPGPLWNAAVWRIG